MLCSNLAGYFFLSMVAFCGITDFAKHKVLNIITYPLMVCGIIYGIHSGFWKESLLGFAVAFGISLVGFFLKGLGAGDVKLLAAVGAWVGLQSVLSVLLLACFIALPWGLLKLAREGSLKSKAKLWWGSLTILFTNGLFGWMKHLASLEKLPEDGTVPKTAVPFGSCISAAVIIVFVLLSKGGA